MLSSLEIEAPLSKFLFLGDLFFYWKNVTLLMLIQILKQKKNFELNFQGQSFNIGNDRTLDEYQNELASNV